MLGIKLLKILRQLFRQCGRGADWMCHTNYARKEHALLESFKINFILNVKLAFCKRRPFVFFFCEKNTS